MGWTDLLDENDKVIGKVGDAGWDAAGAYVQTLLEKGIDGSSLSLEMAIAYALSPNVKYLREPIKSAVFDFRDAMLKAYKRVPSVDEVVSTIEFVFRTEKENFMKKDSNRWLAKSKFLRNPMGHEG